MIHYIYVLKDNKAGFYSNPILLPYTPDYYKALQERAIAKNDPNLKEVKNLELYYLGVYNDELATITMLSEKEYLLTYPEPQKKEKTKNEI